MTPHVQRIVAYLVLAIGFGIGLWRVESLAQDVRSERVRADVRVCREVNDIRMILLELINQSGGNELPAGVNLEDLDPALQALIRASQEASAEFQKEATILLALKDCELVNGITRSE